jgi:hypothetical protein
MIAAPSITVPGSQIRSATVPARVCTGALAVKDLY